MAILIDRIETLPIEAIILAIIVNELCCHSIYKFAVMFMPDPALNTRYFGLTGNVGFGTPGKEFHVEWGTTVTLPYTQFNVYEVARSVYIKIMEW